MKILKWLCMIAIAAMLPFFSSCLKGSINGELDGQWQIMELEHNGDGVAMQGRRYICIYLHVVQLTEGGVFADGNMVHDKTSVSFTFPDTEGADKRKRLEEWGIYEDPAQFQIEQLDRKSLILSNAQTRITCRRF